MDTGKKTTKEKGAEAEEVAARHYQKLGYTILARNYRMPMGELDLVAELYGEILFVEVKGRDQFREEHIDAMYWRAKKRKIRRMAQVFLSRHEEELNYYCVRLAIVYVTKCRVKEVFEDEPFV